jgi:type II secretory pathway component PulJ
MNPPNALRGRRGFTIVEAMAALTLLAVGLVPLLSLGLGLDRQSEQDARYEEALAAARASLERCRQKSFAAVSAGEPEASDHDAIRVSVSANRIDEGLLRLKAVATWRSVAGGEARLELASLLADPELSLNGHYALEVVQ